MEGGIFTKSIWSLTPCQLFDHRVVCKQYWVPVVNDRTEIYRLRFLRDECNEEHFWTTSTLLLYYLTLRFMNKRITEGQMYEFSAT